MEETEEPVELIERVAALDIGKATLEACVRVPHPTRPGRRCQEVRSYPTTTGALLELTRLAARRAGDAGGHGGHLNLLEGTVGPA